MRLGFHLLTFALLISSAKAETYCEYYRAHEPDLYTGYCGDGNKVKTAGANSTFTNEFNISAASLPTEPSSYGIETLVSGIRGGSGGYNPTFSIIKGFHRFGTGISTGSNNTFYGDDVVERISGPPNVTALKPSETPQGYITNLNLGTSFDVLDIGRLASLKLGASLRYNQITNTLGGGPAALLGVGIFSFGAGITNEKISNTLERINFTNYFFGVRLWMLEFEYTWIENNLLDTLEGIRIYTVTASVRKFLFTVAMRKLNYLTVGDVTQYHFGVQWLANKHFSVGYLYNYIPGANTLGLQIYL